MKKLFALALIMLSFGAIAQSPTKSAATVAATKYKVSGFVKDSVTRQPVSYSTIIVRDTTQKLITSTYAADKGQFEFRVPSGSYIAVVGFTDYTPDTVRFDVKDKNIELGNIVIREGVDAGTVQVFGQLVTSDIDKTTYNVSADPESQVINALDMMRKAPLLTVDGEDNIQLKGQSDFKILVNGKPSGMMSKNYKDVLKSMPASSIKAIEVITNPPAKYDSEGIGGIINIVTVRKSLNGYNGSINAGADQWGSVNGGGYVAAEFGKFAISANLYVSNYRRPSSENNNWRVDSLQDNRHFMKSAGSGQNTGFSGGGSIEASYSIDSLNLITVNFGLYSGSSDGGYESVVEYLKRDGSLYSKYAQQSINNSSYMNIDGGLDYQLLFKKPDRSFTLSYRFSHSPDVSNYVSNITEIENYRDAYSRRSSNEELRQEHTLQADYYDPLTKVHQIEAGLKYIFRPSTTNSNNEVWDEFTGTWLEDMQAKNDLDYTQHIGSFYGGYALKLKKFSARAGFRGEFTINQGTVKMATQNIPLFGRYFNLVPYVTTNFKINDVHSLRAGYTQRLRRPYIWDLNPYVNDLDPTYVRTGNPNLDAVVSNAFDLSYSISKQTWNVSASASYYMSNNGITYLQVLRGPGEEYEGRLFTRPENMVNEQSARFGLDGSVRFFGQKLRVSANISGSYDKQDAPRANLHNEGFRYNVGGSIYGQPWKNGSVSFYANYGSSSTNLQGKSSGYTYSSISVSQRLLKDKLNISLSCSNPWETKREYSSETYGPGFSSGYQGLNWSRSFRMSIGWRFGKMESAGVKKARRGITNDDGGGSKGGSGGAQ